VSAERKKGGSEELSALIRDRREELGLSRRDLADATDLSYPYISQLETGYRLPSHRAMQVLGKALQVEPSVLFHAVGTDEDDEPHVAHSGRRSGDTRYLANPVRGQLAEVVADRLPPESGKADPVAVAVEALSTVPANRRLEALNAVQAAGLEGLVAERRRG
jgi:transcriptional regulator with XRE-family HTH domain